MAASRILTSLAVLVLACLAATVCSYPTTTGHKFQQQQQQQQQQIEGQAMYEDLLRQALEPSAAKFTLPHVKNSRLRFRNNGGAHGLSWSPEQLAMRVKQHRQQADADAKADIGKRDYGDLGFFFGKRSGAVALAEREEDAFARQNRNYGDLGMFFGKRSGNELADDLEAEFADFAE